MNNPPGIVCIYESFSRKKCLRARGHTGMCSDGVIAWSNVEMGGRGWSQDNFDFAVWSAKTNIEWRHSHGYAE